MSETEITVRGHIGNQPELVANPGKKAMTRLRVATSKRIRTPQGWSDGPTSWYDVKVWGDFAQNVTESLRKGDAIVVQGELYIEEFTTTSGVTHRTPVIHARALGPDLRGARARVARIARGTAEPAERPDAHGAADGGPAMPPEPAVDLSGMVEVVDTGREEPSYADR